MIRIIFGSLLVLLFIFLLVGGASGLIIRGIPSSRELGEGIIGIFIAALFLLLPGTLLIYFGWRSRSGYESSKRIRDMSAEELLGFRSIEGVRCPYKDCGRRSATARFTGMQGIYESWITYCAACGRKSSSLSAEEISRLEKGLPLF